MSNIIISRAGNGYHVLQTGPALHLVLARGDDGLEAFSRDPALDSAGVYVAISRTGYVGCSKSSVSSRTFRRILEGSMPDALLAIVGGAKPLLDREARALERIVFQSYDNAGLPLRNRAYPEGAPVGHERYSELQGYWAEAVAALRTVAPTLACGWTGPDYLVPPVDTGEPLPTRWHGVMGEADATLCSSGSGYVVEAGSRIRLEPIPSAPALCQTMREELAFAGVLVREPFCLRLTRDVYLPTLAACSRFVFTGGGSAYWRVDDCAEDVLFEPAFTPDYRR